MVAISIANSQSDYPGLSLTIPKVEVLEMTAYLLTDHLFNFLAPAAFLALGLVLLARIFGRFFKSKRPMAYGLYTHIAIIFIVNMIVLIAGMVFFGHDAKMMTYAALIVGAAGCQWVLWRGWAV